MAWRKSESEEINFYKGEKNKWIRKVSEGFFKNRNTFQINDIEIHKKLNPFISIQKMLSPHNPAHSIFAFKLEEKDLKFQAENFFLKT